MTKNDKEMLRGELNVILHILDSKLDEIEKLYGELVSIRNDIYRIGERRGLYDKKEVE